MAKRETREGSDLNDDELVVLSITYGFKHHYPGRIRIGDILRSEYGCDWQQLETVRQLIVHYGIAKYADSDETDLLISIDGANAIKSGDPITYMNNLREEQKPKPSIFAHNSVVGNNNSHNNVGQDFRISPQSQPNANQIISPAQASKHEVKMSTAQFIVWLLTFFVSGVGIGFAICNAMKH